MADLGQVARLKQGDNDWNSWRTKNAEVVPDLSEANLRGLMLGDVNLARAILTGADFNKTMMVSPNFESADLTKANLSDANRL